MILHLTSRSDWEAAVKIGEYTCASLYSEGFIHLSTIGQIVKVANTFYQNLNDAVLLLIDQSNLGGALKWEGSDGHSFPHLYRSLLINEVVEVLPWPQRPGGFEITEEMQIKTGYKSIETERLILREFDLRDVNAVLKYSSDSDLVKFMPWGPNDLRATHEFLSRNFIAQSEKKRTAFDFAIVEKKSMSLIGGGGLFLRPESTQTGYIGYILSRESHGKGYATEVAKTLIELGFNQFNLHRIEATCDSDNAASFRVMERAGMTREGLLRENLFVKGKRRSTFLYSILKSEN